MTKKLIVAFVVLRIVYSSVLTFWQYFNWKNGEFSKFFLPPYQSINYFIKYSFLHFWLSVVFGMTVAFLFYFVLKTAGRFFNPRSDAEANISNEPMVGLFGALIAGWPNFIVFLVVALILAVIFSAYRGIIYKKTNIGLFWPFVFSTAIALVFGNYLINFFHLAVLRI